jgi:5'-nucleotidase
MPSHSAPERARERIDQTGPETHVQILLTNDDGIQAPGLCALYPELTRLGNVQIVAPASEQSGVGLSITYRRPLLVHEETRDGRPWGWAVAGSPADCVKLGVLQFCKETPRLIVSGINSGANVGINVLYSGTVAAAIEGAFFGITSVAVSQAYGDGPPDYAKTARDAVKLIEQLLSHNPRPGTLWNMNFPVQSPEGPRGVKVLPMGVRRHVELMEKRLNPRGGIYFWSGSTSEGAQLEPETDVRELAEGYATLTPLHIDMTHRQLLDRYAEYSWSID